MERGPHRTNDEPAGGVDFSPGAGDRLIPSSHQTQETIIYEGKETANRYTSLGREGNAGWADSLPESHRLSADPGVHRP